MKVHFIAIGGSAMHNIAIDMKNQGHDVSGSDNEIFEPSYSRLKKANLFPEKLGWYEENISSSIDFVVLGMHAKADNPELLKAQNLGLRIVSYPEYLYECTKDKTRIVIGGSHGKTTITSMILHILKYAGRKFDYMVGAQIEGFQNMVSLSADTDLAVFEGDEYLSSTLDKRPKFHLYKPHIAVISGISWDHINVFPSFDIYKQQFIKFIDCIEEQGTLIFSMDDFDLKQIAEKSSKNILKIPYTTHPNSIEKGITFLESENGKYQLQVFGQHNLQNISAALEVCLKIGIDRPTIYSALATFKGSQRRLQLLANHDNVSVFLDFAHAPSKLIATTQAVKTQFPERKLVACFELHTYSSMNVNFLGQYKDSLSHTDMAFIFLNPHSLAIKGLEPISESDITESFNKPGLEVFFDANLLMNKLLSLKWENMNLLLMSSGNFSGMQLEKLSKLILNK